MWNARIGIVLKLNREIFVALPLKSTFVLQPASADRQWGTACKVGFKMRNP